MSLTVQTAYNKQIYQPILLCISCIYKINKHGYVLVHRDLAPNNPPSYDSYPKDDVTLFIIKNR